MPNSITPSLKVARAARASPTLQELVYISHDVFDAYRKHHYKAGCHLGVISSYILQIFVVHLRDIEGRLQKLVSIVANLVNVYGPVQQQAKTDWAVFRLLHWASLLQRAHPDEVWRSARDNELTAAGDAAQRLVADVGEAAKKEAKAAKVAAQVVFVTSAWGWMSEVLPGVLKRWQVVSKTPLLVLCRDRMALDRCSAKKSFHVRCVKAPQRLGVEAWQQPLPHVAAAFMPFGYAGSTSLRAGKAESISLFGQVGLFVLLNIGIAASYIVRVQVNE